VLPPKAIAKRDFIREVKDQPCTDCGTRYPFYVMHFDHRPDAPKLFNVGTGVDRVGWDMLRAEVAKCDVVCANCHAMRTWQRRFPTAGRRSRAARR
jgi:hypothetical protein